MPQRFLDTITKERMGTAITSAVAVGMAAYVLLKPKATPKETTAPLAEPLLTMPKVELHVHLDGSFDATLLFTAAQARAQAGMLPPDLAERVSACADLAAFKRLVQCQETDRSLQAMIDRFEVFLPFVQGDLDLIEQLAYKFVAQQAAQNVIYTEVRYSPQVLTLPSPIDPGVCSSCSSEPLPTLAEDSKAVVAAVTRGLRRGCEHHPGIEINQILCFMDSRPHWASSLADLAMGEGRMASLCRIVAVDVAAGEAHFAEHAKPAAGELRNGFTHRSFMCKCGASGLGVTVHAGESGPTANVEAAMSDAYGRARRIGHGYAAVADAVCTAANDGGSPAAVVSAFKGLGIPEGLTFECCPTSSRATGGWTGADWATHPIAALLRLRTQAEQSRDHTSAGALPRVTLSSDDPSVFSSSLTEECRLAVDAMGLDEAALRQLMLNAVGAAFLDADGKVQLRKRFDAAWSKWAACRESRES